MGASAPRRLDRVPDSPDGILDDLPAPLRGPNSRVRHWIPRDEWVYDGGPFHSRSFNRWAAEASEKAPLIVDWAATNEALYLLTPRVTRRFPWGQTKIELRRKRSTIGMKGALVQVHPASDEPPIGSFWVAKSAARNIAAVAAHHGSVEVTRELY